MIRDSVKLRLVRESMSMTQEKLAILSNVSERTVQRAEEGANMRLDALADFAAALEIPLSELALELENYNGDKDVSLRLIRTARTLADDLAKAGVARFDCEVDPAAHEMEAVLELFALFERQLPTPWEMYQPPAAAALSETIRLAARVRDLLERLAELGIGFYAVSSWINAQYPRWDMDEGRRYTKTDQHFEKVMTLQMTISRGSDDRIYRKPIQDWGLQIEPPSLSPAPVRSFGNDLDDDAPF